MENVYPLNPKQLGTYQKRPQPANHFTQSAGKDLITPQTWRKTGKREKCGLEHAIETGRGGVYLRLTSEQYARLKRP